MDSAYDAWLVLTHFGLYRGPATDKPGIICPFHKDSNPSLSVTTRYGYRCWACPAKGTLIDLVVHFGKQYEHPNFHEIDALLLISRLRKHPPAPVEETPLYTRLNEDEAVVFSRAYFETLHQPDWNRLDNYILERGFEPPTLKHFDARVDTHSYHPFVFPILQQEGFKGFVARGAGKAVDPKYMYNQGFVKKKTIGGTLRRGEVMIVEGYLDLMRTWQNSYPNVACLFGWDCSDEQEAIIRQYATSVVIGLDNDEYGNIGAKKLKQRFQDLPCYRFIMKREKKDPGALNKRLFDIAYASTRKF